MRRSVSHQSSEDALRTRREIGRVIGGSVVAAMKRAAEETACIPLLHRAEQDTRGNYWFHGEDRLCRAARPAVSAAVLLAKP